MTIGPDLKETAREVGIPITITRDGVTLSGEEYITYELNRQVTKPFIREFFVEADLPYDTETAGGDVIEFSDGRRFLLMNKTPDQLMNEIINYNGVLYKTNISDAKILRWSGEEWDADYLKAYSWALVQDDLDILITETLYGHGLESDLELAQFGLERHDCYIPSSVGVQALDRLEWVSGEFYKVDIVKRRRFDGVDVLELSEDTRL